MRSIDLVRNLKNNNLSTLKIDFKLNKDGTLMLTVMLQYKNIAYKKSKKSRPKIERKKSSCLGLITSSS